ncbi:MAG: 23S rRNA (adenine(2503)-C(2))-methyltransferase RlmN [Acidobacteria bacterium]|jgi:23S rRNA (adenine2503-C2)-methyltransferase|nr:23S rRNA (adenine(2503)-C(2))-methyltransferase RlmN [Acidobacteriota bacterium]MCU0252920.1 23S rRNA (adenine(2503)-C(2))-methyltransferase RlmN [Acidobacteriota bacterium]
MTTSDRGPINLYGLEEPALAELLAPLDPARFRARQVFSWLYGRGVTDITAWTDLSKSLRAALAARFSALPPRVASRHAAADGTIKFTLELPRGGRVEAVAIPADERMTFCISSQVGCGFGCAFCMTAKLGFTRNLDAGEIVGQVAALVAETATPPGEYNIVFMGMGEPLQNLENVLAALRLLTHERGFGLGPRRITVSTVGLPKGIRRLAQQPAVPRLAVSLVAADQELRSRLMPIARTVTLEELADAVREFGQGRRDEPTLECVMLDGVNDAPELAHELAKLARRAGAKVNLIEFNPTPALPFRPSSEARLELFLRVLSAAGVVGTVRRSRGKDAFAACGQLAFLQQP